MIALGEAIRSDWFGSTTNWATADKSAHIPGRPVFGIMFAPEHKWRSERHKMHRGRWYWQTTVSGRYDECAWSEHGHSAHLRSVRRR